MHSLERLCQQSIPTFHNLRVGQRPMNDCPENFPKIFFPRLWNDPDLDTMLGKPTG